MCDHSKAVNQLYEEYVLSYGDFDERIFLRAEAEAEIGTPAKCGEGVRELSQQVRAERNLQQHFNEVSCVEDATFIVLPEMTLLGDDSLVVH